MKATNKNKRIRTFPKGAWESGILMILLPISRETDIR